MTVGTDAGWPVKHARARGITRFRHSKAYGTGDALHDGSVASLEELCDPRNAKAFWIHFAALSPYLANHDARGFKASGIMMLRARAQIGPQKAEALPHCATAVPEADAEPACPKLETRVCTAAEAVPGLVVRSGTCLGCLLSLGWRSRIHAFPAADQSPRIRP